MLNVMKNLDYRNTKYFTSFKITKKMINAFGKTVPLLSIRIIAYLFRKTKGSAVSS